MQDIRVKLENRDLLRQEQDKFRSLLDDPRDKNDNFVGFISMEDQRLKIQKKIDGLQKAIDLKMEQSDWNPSTDFLRHHEKRPVNYQLQPIEDYVHVAGEASPQNHFTEAQSNIGAEDVSQFIHQNDSM
jgi:hypothetical protein